MTNQQYKSGDTIKLVIDENTLNDYNNFYFSRYPKRKVPPIDRPTHPSINAWFVMRRPEMNALKGKWKEFIVWFVENEGLSGLKIQGCKMECTSYLKTKIRADVDNMSPKFLIDGLVEAGFIVDDDYKHIHSLTLKIDYDKDRPRTEILVRID
jgi:Holliday junction resolvase RusA-like endonuclease